MKEPRANILGVGVSPLTMPAALECLHSWIADGAREYVCVANVHTVMECGRAEALREIFNCAGMVTPDGMPLVWLCQRLGFPETSRVYGPDLLLAVCAAGWGCRHYFYGGAPGVAERLATSLQKAYPGLQVVGVESPPFRPLTEAEKSTTIQRLNAARPDIVWVGLGAPKQEYWMAEFRPHLQASVLVGVGAAFDFHSGTKRQAPLWMQRRGLEWVFRLFSEPRRLWKRYLLNNPLFVWRVLGQLTKLRTVPELCCTEQA